MENGVYCRTIILYGHMESIHEKPIRIGLHTVSAPTIIGCRVKAMELCTEAQKIFNMFSVTWEAHEGKS